MSESQFFEELSLEDAERTVIVNDLPPDVDDDDIMTVFECARYNGGPVERIRRTSSTSALVIYEDKNVAAKLLASASEKPPRIIGASLSVLPHPLPAQQGGCSIVVSGITEKVEIDDLWALLESKRKGGGPVETISPVDENGSAVVMFAEESVAKHWVEVGELKFGQVTFTFSWPSATKSSKADETDPHTIFIHNVPPEMPETLELVLETKRVGGGPIDNFSVLDDGTVVVKFQDEYVAQHFIEQGYVEVASKRLMISNRLPKVDRSFERPRSQSDNTVHDSPAKTIEVSGIPKTTSEDLLKMYFESEKRSGGGDIIYMQYNKAEGLSTITFRDPQAVVRIMKKEEHKIADAVLDVIVLESLSNELCDKECAVCVSGILSTISSEFIEVYFESEKRSGGGATEEILFSDSKDSAIITFADCEVAKRVAARKHVVEKSVLTVERLKAAPPPPILMGETDKEKLLFRGLPLDKTRNNKDTLTEFIGRVSGCTVRHVTYASQPDVAVVDFSGTPDYYALRKLVVSKPFGGQMISVQKVSPTSVIIVHGVQDLSEDMITLHFENPKRSGGGDVKSVKLNAKKNYCLVEFKDRNVVSKVLQQKQMIDKHKVQVDLYYPYLADSGQSGSRKIPVTIPGDVVMTVDGQKCKFIRMFEELRKEIAGDLANECCEVTWPDSDDDQMITLRCTLTPESDDAAKLVVDWAARNQAIVNRHLASITNGEEKASAEVWKDFVGEMKSLAPKELESMWVNQDDSCCTLRFTGRSEIVDKFHSHASLVLNRLMEDLAKKKSKKFESVSNISPVNLEIIKRSRFWESLSKDLEVTFDGRGILFQGAGPEIMEAKVKMYEEVVSKIQSKSFVCEPFKLKVLQKPEVVEYFKSIFEKRGLNIGWIVGDKELSVSGSNVDLNDIFSTIKESIAEKKLTIDASSALVLGLREWHELVSNLSKQFPNVEITVAGDKSSVACCGIRDSVQTAIEQIGKFLRNNTILEDFMKMSEGRALYLQKHMAKELKEIMDSLSSDAVKLEPVDDGAKSGFIVRGTQHGVAEGKECLLKLSREILEVSHGTDIPGTQRYFMSKRGHDSLEKIQNNLKVIIIVSKEQSGPFSDGADGLLLGADSGPSDQMVLKSKVMVDNGFNTVIKILKGSIANCHADALIASIGDDLKWTDGVAKIVADAGGKEIEEDSQMVLRGNGKPLPGQAFSTRPGLLSNYLTIIHAVLTPWQNGLANEQNLLFEAIFRSLELAANSKLSSVAIAGIRCGFPPGVAAKVLLEVVHDFQKESHKFREIILIDATDQVVNHFHENLVTHFGKEQVKMPDDHHTNEVVPSSPSGPVRPLSSRYSKTANPLTLTTPEGVNVTLVMGAIADQKVDVIVNTISQDLNLTHGAVSNSLLQVAGQGLQTEINGFKGKATSGQIIVTGGHNLGCKQVYHCSFDKWDGGTGGGKCEKTMRDLLKASFNQAHAAGMTSIAIPAIGTGNLMIPRDFACQVMFDEVDSFAKNNPSTKLKNVNFVVYDKDYKTVSVFDSAIRQSAGPTPVAPPRKERRVKNVRSASVPNSPLAGEEEKPKKNKRKGTGRGKGGHGAVNLHNKHIKIGALTLEVVQGDITEEDTDAIVNSTNDSLTLQGGAVTQAILRKGGKSIEQECKKIGRTTDNIAVTKAGNLPCKHIIHLAAPPAFEKKAPSSKDWEERIIKVLEKAEDMKLMSVAFPLLGTGKWTTPAAEMAGCILNAVGEFCASVKPVYLKLVRITIFQDNMVDDFAAAVTKKVEERKSRGALGRFRDWWTGVGDIQVVDCDDEDASDVTTELYTKLVFRIYGIKQSAIDQVIHEIDDLGKEAITDKVLDSAEHQAQIAKLTQDQIKRMNMVANQQGVKITIEKGKKLNRIRLQGDGSDVATVYGELFSILHEVEVAEHKKAEAELIAQQAHWDYRLPDGSFESYPAQINAIIEKAFQAKQPFAEWVEDDDTAFKLDFAQSLEFTKNGNQPPIPVRRICDVPIPQPRNWDPMPPGKPLLIVDIPIGSKEFEEVEKNIRIAPRTTIKEIIKIERIQNPNLFQQYAVRKMHMEAANGPKVVNERILWHGTAYDTIEQINVHGFNRSYCGKNATAYGKGVYFASEWWYSANDTYSPPDTNGNRYIYQAKVLTGDFAVGQAALIDTPLKAGSTSLRYDSVVNDVNKPLIFVIFRDAQAYPEYLITFI